MTQAWDCTETRLSLGVYVLGAIDPVERGLVDAHLASCRDCRDELAGLAGLPALLARLDPDEVTRITADDADQAAAHEPAPAELLGTVLDLARSRRRRTRWQYLAAAAAVVVLAAGLFGGLRAAGTRTVLVPGDHPNWESATATSQVTGASATVAYAPQQWGSTFDVLVDHIPIGTTCQLWVVHPDGTRTEAATWTTAGDEGKAWYPGSMAATAGAISQFQITTGNRVLVTVTPT
jgi:Putative zinc-finger